MLGLGLGLALLTLTRTLALTLTKADFAAGHSLGEIAALHAAGALDRESAFNLVCHRAMAMANAATAPKDEAMAAVIGPG
jgi:malonyl CoA-acyl carrier protein transacylase